MGLVARESHERDARLALVVLTETGSRVVDEALATADVAADRAFAARWSAGERERLAELVSR
jgi:DNA-binding MarR family transcriptional regulator